MSGPTRRRRGVVIAVLAAALTVLLAGCGGVIGSLINTKDALSNAGFQSVGVSVTTNNDVTISVRVAARPSGSNVLQVAAIVWHDVHQRFDAVQITVHGDGPTVYDAPTFAVLQQRFGPRNPAWNRTSISAGLRNVGIIAIVVVVVFLGLVALLVVLLVRRHRRRRGPPDPPWGAPQWGAPQWSPGGPPTGWAPPQAPGGWSPPPSPPADPPAPGAWGPPTGA